MMAVARASVRGLAGRAVRVGVQLGLSAGIIALGVWGYRTLGNRAPPPERKGGRSSVSEVRVAQVVPYDGALELDLGGVVRPAREVRLAAEVGGRVAFRAPGCRSGDVVEAGAVLFRLDRADHELAARQAALAVEQAQLVVADSDVEVTNLTKMVALAAEDLALAAKEHTRVRQLRQQAVASASALEQVQQREIAVRMVWTTQSHTREMAEGRRARAAVALEISREHAKRAALDLARTEVRAPPAATPARPGRWRVVRRSVEQDDLVGRGQELVVLEDATLAEVHCALSAAELALVWDATARAARTPPSNDPAPDAAGARPRARVLADGRAWEGVLARIDGQGVDERTRLVTCIIEVAPDDASGAGPALVRGTYVRVALAVRPGASLLALPARAVRPGGIAWKVEGGQLRVVALDVVRRAGEVVLVRPEAGSVAVGDTLVVSPLEYAADGMPVVVVP